MPMLEHDHLTEEQIAEIQEAINKPVAGSITCKELFDNLIEAILEGQPYSAVICLDTDMLRVVRRFEQRVKASELIKSPWTKTYGNMFDFDGCIVYFTTIEHFALFM